MTAVFDQLAERYDALWSDTAIGRNQRAAVWRWVDPLLQPGNRILDLGCGTGKDAEHFMARGIEVYGIDASAGMVRVARARGIPARTLAIEAIEELSDSFDGAISDFGALNCIADLKPVARALGRLIRPRGYVAICVAGRCCAWEALYYLRRLSFRKAFRRWRSGGSRASIGVQVYYPSVRDLAGLFRQDFRLIRWCGIGLCTPPSYVGGISERALDWFSRADHRLAHLPVLRALTDHRLLVFQRI
jgi:ubiquinone/menaquinone biosynthesis C-methylase UbiE